MNQQHNHIKINCRIFHINGIKTALLVMVVLLGWLNSVSVRGQTWVTWNTGVGGSTLRTGTSPNYVNNGSSTITGTATVGGVLVNVTVTASVNLDYPSTWTYGRPSGFSNVIWSSDNYGVYNGANGITNINNSLGTTTPQWFWTYKIGGSPTTPPNILKFKFDKDVVISELGIADQDASGTSHNETFNISGYEFTSQTNNLISLNQFTPVPTVTANSVDFANPTASSSIEVGIEWIKLSSTNVLPANTELVLTFLGKEPSTKAGAFSNNNLFNAFSLKLAEACTAPSITTQPTGNTYCHKEPASPLSVTATGTTPLTYQWYRNTTNSTTGGTAISGATNATYTPSTANAGTLYYYVVISNSCGTVTSSVVAITVKPNLWVGGTSTAWNVASNWSCNRVPTSLASDADAVVEDVEFATTNNYGSNAVRDLYVDAVPRKIRNLINSSPVNLVVPVNTSLTILEKVSGTKRTNTLGVQVKSSASAPTGSLVIRNQPAAEPVSGTVEFYNKGYDCDCGEYQQKWQYFGIPVLSASAFPAPTTGLTVNRWDEFINGNKWIGNLTASPLNAFEGYEITSTSTTVPTTLYPFTGTLVTGSTTIPFVTSTPGITPSPSLSLTNTTGVNYAGMNLIGNSYTAAIPISTTALQFSTGFADKTVYLFNTGTRDEWRKLDGSTVNQAGYRGGQYLAVPVNLGGTANFPASIPSMHAFMVKANASASLTIDYTKLVKNTTVNNGNGTQITWRSVNASSDSSPLGGESPQGERGAQTAPRIPGLVVDVIGPASADRVWLFVKEGTTRGFDNGWDGTKMTEPGLAQLYVSAEGGDKFQVATVPSADSTALGFVADTDGEYTFNFALFDAETGGAMYLVDTETGARQKIEPKAEHTFTAKKGEHASRFRIEGSLRSSEPDGNAADRIFVTATAEGGIMIENKSGKTCSAIVFDRDNKLLHRKEVKADGTEAVQGLAAGTYIVRFQNAEVSAVRRVKVN